MAEKSLYFIALIPPEPVYADAQHWKEWFAENHASNAALRSPPHITLHMPFRLKQEKEPDLTHVLADVSREFQPFDLVLNGFGQFNHRTIFIDVEVSDALHNLFLEIRKAMKLNFQVFNADYKNRGYHPHLTLAFRDLKKEAFANAWPIFKDKPYHSILSMDQFALLRHNGHKWEVLNSFSFRK